MATLVLASEPSCVFQAIFNFVPLLHNRCKVAYVWTAAKAEQGYENWLSINTARLKSFGWDVIPMDIEAMEQGAIATILADCDAVHMEGGNTFFLLNWIKESGFDSALTARLLDPNFIYLGCSAGSIVAGAAIDTAGWLNMDANDCGITDLTALELIPDMIYPHYNEQKAAAVAPLLKNAAHRTHLLSDEQFLLVQNDAVCIINADLSTTLL